MMDEPVYLPPKSDDPKYQAGAYWAVDCGEPEVADLLVKQMMGQVSHNVWQFQSSWVIAGPCHDDPFYEQDKFPYELVRETHSDWLEDVMEFIVNKYSIPIPFGANADLQQIGGSGVRSRADSQAHPLDKING